MNVNLKTTLIWAAAQIALGLTGWAIIWMITGNHYIVLLDGLGVLMSVWLWGMIRISLS